MSQVFKYLSTRSKEASSRTEIRKNVGASLSRAALENRNNTHSVVDVDGETLMHTGKSSMKANCVTKEPS